MNAGEAAGLVLVCSSCQEVWEPELLDPDERVEAMSTGCRCCGGWIWVGELAGPVQPAAVGAPGRVPGGVW